MRKLTLLLVAASGLAVAQSSSVPPEKVVERLKKEIGNALLRNPAPFAGARLVHRGISADAGADGVCSVRMPRADVASSIDKQMVKPLEAEEVRQQYAMPQAVVPAPECSTATSPAAVQPQQQQKKKP